MGGKICVFFLVLGIAAVCFCASEAFGVPQDSVGEGPREKRLDKSSLAPVRPAAPPARDKTYFPGMWINPTAPNDAVRHLRGDFTDSDGDGMTDVAEAKYGFDPSDPSSFPEPPAQVNGTGPALVGGEGHKISFSFKDFPAEAETQYRHYLTRLFPLLYHYLGPPAETFNCVITNMGADSNYFMITNNGRTFWTDTDFIPRLIAHELVHAWKGKYTFTSDENWNYTDELSGFEEATAEGMAFILMHEYVRSYPTDEATLDLMDWEPYQYWASKTTYSDFDKYTRWTGAGDFWTHTDGEITRYSIAATTFQEIMQKYPNFYRGLMAAYYERINGDSGWRSNRADLMELWEANAPVLQGVPLSDYLDTIPVFQGKKLDQGMYVLDCRRFYGSIGDQQLVTTWVNKDGKTWWGILKSHWDEYQVPEWIAHMDFDPPDKYYYINTQGQPYLVDIHGVDGGLRWSVAGASKVQTDYILGYGWAIDDRLAMEDYPLGLFREVVTFTNYVKHDMHARDEFYFMGYGDLGQYRYDYEYVIMVGVAGPESGTVSVTLETGEYTSPLENGVAVFRSADWHCDMEGEIPIVVKDGTGRSHTYYRTLLEAATVHGMFQFQFAILDKDFDGVEDHVQALRTGVSHTRQTVSDKKGGGSVLVDRPFGTAWTARSNSDWLAIDTGSSGSGRGRVHFVCEPNEGEVARTGSLTVDGQLVTITQLPYDPSTDAANVPGPGRLALALCALILAASACFRLRRAGSTA